MDSPPDYYGPPAVYVGVSGAHYLDPNTSGTWTAGTLDGTAPYSFTWSGIVTGTGQTLTATPTTSGYLYLDVWDAAGQHAETSVYVTVDSGCGPNAC